MIAKLVRLSIVQIAVTLETYKQVGRFAVSWCVKVFASRAGAEEELGKYWARGAQLRWTWRAQGSQRHRWLATRRNLNHAADLPSVLIKHSCSNYRCLWRSAPRLPGPGIHRVHCSAT